MNTNPITKLSHTLRLNESILNSISSNSYIVFTDLTSLPKEQLESRELLIKTFTIKKRKNGEIRKRQIYFPYSDRVKSTLKILSSYLSSIYIPPDYVHGFIKNRGIKTNAENHLGCKHLLKLDFDNFYEQIDENRIIDSLVNIGITKEEAIVISQITSIENTLVQGFSTSPVISNIVSIKLDEELESYARKNELIYTRYADDMSFSSKTNKPNIDEITAIINSHSFILNDQKTRSSVRGNFQSVTGLTIFDELHPRIRKRIKRRLRLEVHYIKLYGLKNHAIKRLKKNGQLRDTDNEKQIESEMDSIRDRIGGWINFSNGVEKEFSHKLKTKLYS